MSYDRIQSGIPYVDGLQDGSDDNYVIKTLAVTFLDVSGIVRHLEVLRR